MIRWLAPAALALALHAGGALIPLPAPAEEPPPPTLRIVHTATPAPIPAAEPPGPTPHEATRPASPTTPATVAPRRSPRPNETNEADETPALALGEPEAPALPVTPVADRFAAPDAPALPSSTPPRTASAEPRGASPDQLRAYARRVRATMHRAKRYPPVAIRRKREGSARVRVEISSNGTLASTPRLERSTGFPDLDREVLRMATASAPYPPPPKGTEGPVSVVVPVHFSLSNHR